MQFLYFYLKIGQFLGSEKSDNFDLTIIFSLSE